MKILPLILLSVLAAAQTNPTPCAGLPPGKHSLLEQMTAQFGLTCAQQLKIEPMLHDEESVTKPLLKFSSLTPEEKQGVMLTIKLAARRLIRTELTADQQKGMDAEVENVAKSGGGKRGGSKKIEPPSPGLEDEESLSRAIVKYAALTADEKKAMLLKVKQAARADSSQQLSTEQQKKLDAEIAELRK